MIVDVGFVENACMTVPDLKHLSKGFPRITTNKVWNQGREATQQLQPLTTVDGSPLKSIRAGSPISISAVPDL